MEGFGSALPLDAIVSHGSGRVVGFEEVCHCGFDICLVEGYRGEASLRPTGKQPRVPEFRFETLRSVKSGACAVEVTGMAQR